ncbi:DUF3445 domain-containing protein [Myxococcus sp. K15C18031901]|uniref:heme-dependent oxidative N-demethylase family protein n=1 Tax=Myxococcus dinghuensis TaxID=2906761 RepID=UPI0020A786C0|nr:heme-dependent oxidative N-demethylase subunit alpha family protein [Myxococcus dinghuensis]MCP3102712.1 DUF3445 domain-containing protein [Myxococcus dinghuensis]
MLPYFPFEQDSYAMALGVRALRPGETLIEVDVPHYLDELAQKDALLREDPRARFQALPGSEPLQWEVARALLRRMAAESPAHFSLEEDGARWCFGNRLTGVRGVLTPGDADSLPLAPLDWVGRQVQEDLLVLDGTREGFPLVAGQLCFPSGWCLDDKMGRPLLAVHAPVPRFAEQVGASTLKLLDGLKPGRPVTRCNWAITVTPRLCMEPRYRAEWRHLFEGITPDDAGARCLLRLERQTLSRFPETGAVLFTIHTYVAPVAGEVPTPGHRQRLARVLRTVPEDMSDYKRLGPLREPLLAWLEREG